MTTAEATAKWKPDWFRINRGCVKAEKLYPDVVAAILCAELQNWAEFGYLIGGHAKVYKLLAFLEAAEEPNVVHRAEVE